MKCSDKVLADMLRALCRMVHCCFETSPPVVRFRLAIGSIAVQFMGDFQMQLPDDKTVSATVSFVDAKGNPAKVDGVPVWAVDNTDVVVVTAADDGMSATFTPATTLGTAQVSVSADADLGAGVTQIVGLGTIEVIAGQAVAAQINFGEPT
jgi:hypothetical protein